MQRHCKHLAAVLIAAQRREHTLVRARPLQSAATAPAPTPRGPARAEPLSPQIQSWLQEFDQDDEELTEEYPRSIRSRIFYVLSANGTTLPELQIETMSVTLRKDDSPSTVKRYTYHAGSVPARHLRPSDRLLLPRLSRRVTYGRQPVDDDPPDTLRRILATGRARWGTAEGIALTEAPERDGQITWVTNPDASQQPMVSAGEGLAAVRIPDPWYVDPTAGADGGRSSLDLPQRRGPSAAESPDDPPRGCSRGARRAGPAGTFGVGPGAA